MQQQAQIFFSNGRNTSNSHSTPHIIILKKPWRCVGPFERHVCGSDVAHHLP